MGVPDVKKAMYSLVDTMLRNWDREKSALPTEGIFLNRVFVGNPGTGKTTVAKLYARLLCATGMLSKDEVMVRSASDFMGQAVGESAQKTKDILKLAEGKALLIDEAYALFDGASKSSGNASYGQQVCASVSCEPLVFFSQFYVGFGHYCRESGGGARGPRHHHGWLRAPDIGNVSRF